MKIIVHNYPLQVGTKVSFPLPVGTKLLRCDTRGTTPTLWVEKPLDATKFETRHFNLYGTGWEIDEGCDVSYVGTCQHAGYVWHCYELHQ